MELSRRDVVEEFLLEITGAVLGRFVKFRFFIGFEYSAFSMSRELIETLFEPVVDTRLGFRGFNKS